MASSVSASNHVLKHIIQKGRQAIYTNYLQRQKMPGYAQDNAMDITNELIIQGGTANIDDLNKMSQDQTVKNNKKDIHGYRSIRGIKMKFSNAGFIKNRKIGTSSPKNRSYFASKLDKQEEVQSNPQKKESKKSIQTKFIKINLPVQEQQKYISEKVRKQEEKRQQEQRNKKIHSEIENQRYKRQQSESIKVSKETDRKNKAEFEKNLNGDTEFTYDSDGKIIFYSTQSRKFSLKKQYPPKINYFFNNQQDSDLVIASKNQDPRHFQSHKIKAASGQAFASSVLKTVNLSKISLNSSLKDTDPIQFMKRNDLFNNNHSRQTSSIPYLQMKAGATYKQKQTNFTITNKDTQTVKTHSQFLSTKGSGFKKFTIMQRKLDQQKQNFSMRIFRDENQESQDQEKPMRTVQNYISKYQSGSSNRPKTSGNTGRITKVNETLALSMLE